MLTEAPVALHFSGHGLENLFQYLGNLHIMNKERGNLLLLEDEIGKADYFFRDDLKELLSNSYMKSEVVFVSSPSLCQ